MVTFRNNKITKPLDRVYIGEGALLPANLQKRSKSTRGFYLIIASCQRPPRAGHSRNAFALLDSFPPERAEEFHLLENARL